MAVNVYHSWLMVALLSAVIVQTESSTQVTVDGYSCGKVTNIDAEEVTLYLPPGQIDTMDDCRFEFTSSTFDHDTCFKMTTPMRNLDCSVEIEYRHFSSLIEKRLTCGDSTSGEEHCAIYTSMSVLFKVSHNFFNDNGVVIKAYRKYDEEEDDGHSSTLGLSVGIPVAVCVISLCICMAKIMCRQAASSDYSAPVEARSVALQNYSNQPSAPGSQTANYPPSAYGFGNQSHPHQPGGYAQGYQPQNYPTGHQPSAPTLNITADYQQPPPSYDEAKNYPITTQTDQAVDNDKSSALPESPQPVAPPPPYPGL